MFSRGFARAVQRPALPVLLFHRDGRGDRTRTTGARHLAAAPTLAASQLLDLVEGSSRESSGLDEASEFDDHANQVPARRRIA